MRCEDALLDLAPHLSGDLAPEGQRRLLEHLASCAACRIEADRLKDLWEQLDEVPLDPPNSQRLRERFSAAMETFNAGLGHGRGHGGDDGRGNGSDSSNGDGSPQAWRPPTLPAQGRTSGLLGWGAAVAAALVMGVLLGRETNARQAPPAVELAALRQELRDTRAMVTLALLRQPSASERLRGVNWTERLDDPSVEVLTALLDALTHDSNVNVRLAAVDALVRFADRPVVRTGVVEALAAASTAPLVKVALIDLLVQSPQPATSEALRQLAKDAAADPAVRDRADRALQQLGAL